MSREVLGAILGSYTHLIAEVEEIKECLQELKSSILHKKSVWPKEQSTIGKLQPKNGTCVWIGSDEGFGDKNHVDGDKLSLGMLPAQKIPRHNMVLSSHGKPITEDCKTKVGGRHLEQQCKFAKPCSGQDADGSSHSMSGAVNGSHYTTNPRTSEVRSKCHRARPKFKRISKAQEIYQGSCSFNTCRELFPILEMEIRNAFN